MPKASIQTRLILLFSLQALIIVLGGGFYLNWRLQQTLEHELSDKLERLASSASLQIDGELLISLSPGDENTRTFRNLKSRLTELQIQTGVRRIFIFTAAKRRILDTKEQSAIGAKYPFLPISKHEMSRLFKGDAVSSILFEGRDGRLYKTGFAPIRNGRKIIAAIAVEGSAKTLDAIATVRRDITILGVVVLAASGILAFVFSKTITRPIERLKSAAQGIARGDYDTSIKAVEQDEIGFLARTMDEMRRAIVLRESQQKTMIAGVAHEIRNPLGGIELFAGLLTAELNEEKGRQEARKILKEVQNLKQILNDFLDYAKPDEVNKEMCSIGEIFREATSLLYHELQSVDVEYREDEDRQAVWCDPQHLKQVFLNLLRNAVAALDGAGMIDVSVARKKSHVKVIFADNGPGIASEIKASVFEPFVTSRKTGTGLGLAIVKSLLEANGGTIRLKKSATGATFEIQLANTQP
jgi:signal transduction histidine kinase